MNETHATQEQIATLLRDTAVQFPYPPTPDVASGVRRRLATPVRRSRRRLAWALAALLLGLGLLLAAPQVRAAVWEFIRAGAITIFVGEPTPTAVAATPISESMPAVPPTPTLPALATAVAEYGTLTSLADAQARADFTLRLPPAYGPPGEVYLQESRDGPIVVLVWPDTAQPGQARLRLHQTRVLVYGLKSTSAENIVQTAVGRQVAYWVEGGHSLRLLNGRTTFVADHVLIWEEAGITYRLESPLSLAEAVAAAEALAPFEE